MESQKTKYYGIYIETDLATGTYWLVSDNGEDQRFDYFPTETEVDSFCDDVRRF